MVRFKLKASLTYGELFNCVLKVIRHMSVLTTAPSLLSFYLE